MQRRRLPQDESRLPYPPPARRKRRPPGRGVVRKGGESPAPAREHPPHRSAWVKPSDRSAESGVGGTWSPWRAGGCCGAAAASSLAGVKSKIRKGGEAAEMELLETPFRGTSWAVSDLPHSAWEDGAGTRLQGAKPTEAQSVRVAPATCSLCSQRCPDSVTPALDSPWAVWLPG